MSCWLPVGSADFFNVRHQGQVNGYLAPRSPGSTLSYLFMPCMERGLITPKHYLEHVPVLYGGYSPENYDRAYSGLVSAEGALQRSLNVPAVNLLADLGGEALHEMIAESRIHHNHTSEPLRTVHGLRRVRSEPLGINGFIFFSGLRRPVLLAQNPDGSGTAPPKTLFSPGVAYVITQILPASVAARLTGVLGVSSLPKVAWKTRRGGRRRSRR